MVYKNNILRAIQHLLFPALCCHCEEEINDQRELLCKKCLRSLEVLDPNTRCLICFTSLVDEEKVCDRCKERRAIFKRAASPFEYSGPAKQLLDRFRAGEQKLSCLLASYMIFQWSRLLWPYPDLIIPVPQSFFRGFLGCGYNPSLFLATEVGKLMERPVIDLLKRSEGDFPQMKLSFEKRLELSSLTFGWKKKSDLVDQSILLIDDLMATTMTLRHSATVLEEAFPAQVYALSCCVQD